MNPLRISLLCLVAASNVSAATLAITVVDPAGAVVPNAYIVVHSNSLCACKTESVSQKKQDAVATTDAKGRATLDLDKGIYDAFVTAPGFSPHCDELQLKHNERRQYKVTLKLNRSKEILHVR